MDSNFSQKVRLHFTFHALLDACIYDNQIFITGFGNDMLHLTVSCNDGEQISVSLSKHSMGHEVAQVIFAKKGIPPSQQRLSIVNKPLLLDASLSDQNITLNKTISCYVPSRGGSGNHCFSIHNKIVIMHLVS